MALRLIEVIIPLEKRGELDALLQKQPVISVWRYPLSEEQLLVKILLPTESTETVVDLLEKRFSALRGFRAILLSVEASIPRPEPREKAPEKAAEAAARERQATAERMYREEVYSDIQDSIALSRTFTALVILSSVVAAIGILKGNIPVIIGAMVIAPLLGPNVALSFATTLGDGDLARKALKTSAIGLLSALLLPILLGILLQGSVDPGLPEIHSRTTVGLGDVIIALVAGAAGGLAFTTGIPTALVGVIIAVALLPALSTSGLLIGARHLLDALGSLLLLATNLICINLAGVVSFLAQGIKPTTWWQEDKAKKATIRATILWALLLSALIVIILLAQKSPSLL